MAAGEVLAVRKSAVLKLTVKQRQQMIQALGGPARRPIANITPFVLGRIFKNFSPRDLICSLAATCRLFCAMAQEPRLWDVDIKKQAEARRRSQRRRRSQARSMAAHPSTPHSGSDASDEDGDEDDDEGDAERFRELTGNQLGNRERFVQRLQTKSYIKENADHFDEQVSVKVRWLSAHRIPKKATRSTCNPGNRHPTRKPSSDT